MKSEMLSMGTSVAANRMRYEFIALTDNNTLVTFRPLNPSRVDSVPVTGLEGTLLGIDLRPANGLIYGLTTDNQIYTIDTDTGVANLVTTLNQPFTGGTISGFDFNPVADRLRVVGDNDQSLRINVDTGEVTVDTSVAFGVGDVNEGVNPNITASGYTNSFAGSTVTELYNIDTLLNTLVLQNPPNDGVLTTVGDLGFNIDTLAGFDIASTADGTDNAAFAVSNGTLYSIDLSTGKGYDLGAIGSDHYDNFQGFTIKPITPPVEADYKFIALTDNNRLVSFESNNPSRVDFVPVTGLEGTLLGVDLRPANGLIYGLTTANQIYTIDPNTGAADLVTTLNQPFTGGTISGFDFNPVADRLRVVGDNDQSLRINVDTGEVTVDTSVAFAVGDVNEGVNPNITASGYTNSFAGSTVTELYNIDTLLNSLVLQNPPNDGVLTTVGDLGFNIDTLAGFDIAYTADATNEAFAVSNGSLYSIDLSTGMGYDLGSIGSNHHVNFQGLTVLPNHDFSNGG